MGIDHLTAAAVFDHLAHMAQILGRHLGGAFGAMGLEHLQGGGQGGFRLAQMVAEDIRTNKEIQAEIMGMSTEPSFKKSQSVSGGIPFMVTKDGKRFQLTAQPIANGEVRKSASKSGDFKTLFKSEFSSFKPE